MAESGIETTQCGRCRREPNETELQNEERNKIVSIVRR